MTLHTTSDGQITYEGLPVANHEEVKYWIWQESGYLDSIYPEVKPDTDYELPDEEFEAKAETPNWIHDERKVVHILRKPVSEEGEKKEYIHDWQDQMTVAARIDPDVADELEELRTYKHVCNESIAHLHRENERLTEVIKMALVRNPPSHTYKILKEGLEKCEGEKNKGLGGSSDLENMIRELLIDLEGHASSYGAHQDKPFHKGKAEAYQYSAKKIRDIFQWLGIETRKP